MCKRLIINAGITQVVVRTGTESNRVIHVRDWVFNDDSLPCLLYTSCAFVCTGVEVNAEFRGLYLAADGYGPGFVDEFACVVAAYLDYLRAAS